MIVRRGRNKESTIYCYDQFYWLIQTVIMFVICRNSSSGYQCYESTLMSLFGDEGVHVFFLMFSLAGGLFLWIVQFHVDVHNSCFDEFFAERLETHFSVKTP